MRRKRGGGRRKGIKVTPLRIAKAAVVVGGLSMIAKGDLDGLIKYGLANPKAVPTVAFAKELARRAGPGAVVAVIGPKLLEKGVQLVSKGEPAIGRVARVKLITV